MEWIDPFNSKLAKDIIFTDERIVCHQYFIELLNTTNETCCIPLSYLSCPIVHCLNNCKDKNCQVPTMDWVLDLMQCIYLQPIQFNRKTMNRWALLYIRCNRDIAIREIYLCHLGESGFWEHFPILG